MTQAPYIPSGAFSPSAWPVATPPYIFTDGFEGGNLDKWQDVVLAGPGSTQSVDATAARNGGFGFRLISTLDAASLNNIRHHFLSANTLTVGVDVRWETEGAGGSNTGGLRVFNDAGLRIADVLRNNSSGTITLRTHTLASGDVFTTPGTVVNLGVWCRLLMAITYNGPGAISTCVLTIDGTIRIPNTTLLDLSSGNFATTQLGFEHAQIAQVSYDNFVCTR
jgi:hypothetical protein